MKKINLLLLIISVAGNVNCHTKNTNVSQTKIDKSDSCSVFPVIIDSLGLQNLYDSARWTVFTWHCDKPYLPKGDSSKYRSFGELALKFDYIKVQSDTVEIDFNFWDGNTEVISTGLKDIQSLLVGVGYNRKTKEKIYMSSPDGYRIGYKGNHRYDFPLQPEVLTYIKSNWNRLDLCFQKLADPIVNKK